jgi:hypothetical protein
LPSAGRGASARSRPREAFQVRRRRRVEQCRDRRTGSAGCVFSQLVGLHEHEAGRRSRAVASGRCRQIGAALDLAAESLAGVGRSGLAPVRMQRANAVRSASTVLAARGRCAGRREQRREKRAATGREILTAKSPTGRDSSGGCRCGRACRCRCDRALPRGCKRSPARRRGTAASSRAACASSRRRRRAAPSDRDRAGQTRPEPLGHGNGDRGAGDRARLDVIPVEPSTGQTPRRALLWTPRYRSAMRSAPARLRGCRPLRRRRAQQMGAVDHVATK